MVHVMKYTGAHENPSPTMSSQEDAKVAQKLD
jgi:hypothetical protein